mgnify:CR=1 FL=1
MSTTKHRREVAKLDRVPLPVEAIRIGMTGWQLLRTLARVKSLPRSQLTPDDIWAALQLHVRVLRISDQRHLIPGILKVYVKLGKFADPPANASAAGA